MAFIIFREKQNDLEGSLESALRVELFWKHYCVIFYYLIGQEKIIVLMFKRV